MKTTKHDLAADHTKLDYMALLQTANIAVGASISDVEKCLEDMHSITKINYELLSQRLLKAAINLNIAAETKYALDQGIERSELEIINKPAPPDNS